MNPAKKIDALEARREQLEQQLLTPGISKEEKIAIRQQITGISNEITHWAIQATTPWSGSLGLPPTVPGTEIPTDVILAIIILLGIVLAIHLRWNRKEPPASYEFNARIPRGASFGGLRKRMFKYAAENIAYDAHIQYTKNAVGVVDIHSDLVVTAYFKKEEQAMRCCQLTADTQLSWTDISPPVVTVNPSQHIPVAQCFEHHYNNADSPPQQRFRAVDSVSSATTIVDQDTIDLESPFDANKFNTKFERCHVIASLKRTARDGDSNWIPLPADVHDLFDGDTKSDQAAMSICPSTNLPPRQHKRKGRSPLVVEVWFFDTIGVEFYHSRLRNPTLVRPGVYEVIVYKKDPDTFKRNLTRRHNAVVQQKGPL